MKLSVYSFNMKTCVKPPSTKNTSVSLHFLYDIKLINPQSSFSSSITFTSYIFTHKNAIYELKFNEKLKTVPESATA